MTMKKGELTLTQLVGLVIFVILLFFAIRFSAKAINFFTKPDDSKLAIKTFDTLASQINYNDEGEIIVFLDETNWLIGFQKASKRLGVDGHNDPEKPDKGVCRGETCICLSSHTTREDGWDNIKCFAVEDMDHVVYSQGEVPGFNKGDSFDQGEYLALEGNYGVLGFHNFKSRLVHFEKQDNKLILSIIK